MNVIHAFLALAMFIAFGTGVCAGSLINTEYFSIGHIRRANTAEGDLARLRDEYDSLYIEAQRMGEQLNQPPPSQPVQNVINVHVPQTLENTRQSALRILDGEIVELDKA